MVVLGIISSVVRDERVDGTSLADSLGALVLVLVTPKGAGTTRLGGLLENAPDCAVFTLTQVKVILSGLALFCDVTTDRAFFAMPSSSTAHNLNRTLICGTVESPPAWTAFLPFASIMWVLHVTNRTNLSKRIQQQNVE